MYIHIYLCIYICIYIYTYILYIYTGVCVCVCVRNSAIYIYQDVKPREFMATTCSNCVDFLPPAIPLGTTWMTLQNPRSWHQTILNPLHHNFGWNHEANDQKLALCCLPKMRCRGPMGTHAPRNKASASKPKFCAVLPKRLNNDSRWNPLRAKCAENHKSSCKRQVSGKPGCRVAPAML